MRVIQFYFMGILAILVKSIVFLIVLVGGVVLNLYIDNPLIVAALSFIINYFISNIGNRSK